MKHHLEQSQQIGAGIAITLAILIIYSTDRVANKITREAWLVIQSLSMFGFGFFVASATWGNGPRWHAVWAAPFALLWIRSLAVLK